MCLAIVVGSLGTKTGKVLLGHNEQNYGRHPVNYRYISNSEDFLRKYKLREYALNYIYAEIPKLDYSDNCINEKGVAIFGNGCPSKINDLEGLINQNIIKKGIGQKFPQVIAKYAKTARDGVEIVKQLMSDYGYISSGRTFVIADESEAFVVSVVQGDSWLAYRVPDEAAVVIANTYVAGSLVNEDFEIEYFGSKDMLDKISSDKTYSFKQEFSKDETDQNMRKETGLDSRQHYLQQEIIGEEISLKEELKFAVVPKEKLGLLEMMQLMRSHHASESVHQSEKEIQESYYRSSCNIATQESAVFDYSKQIVWRAMSVPCQSIFIPYFFNTKMPENLGIKINNHYDPDPQIFKDEKLDYWLFYNNVHKVEADSVLKTYFIKKRDKFEKEKLALVDKLDFNFQNEKFDFTTKCLEEAKLLIRSLEDGSK